MAVISIAEGEAKTASGDDRMLFPHITSCLAIVSFTGTTRRGGHAVLIPEAFQGTLQQICDYVGTTGQIVHVKGDIGTWNQNWQYLPQAQNLTINGRLITSVQEMANALSTGQYTLTDTNGRTQDVTF